MDFRVFSTLQLGWCNYYRPLDCLTSNDEGSRTRTRIKNINLLNDRLEAREQGNRSRFKRYEVLIKLWGFEKKAVIGGKVTTYCLLLIDRLIYQDIVNLLVSQ